MEKINLSNFGFNILQVETKAACNMACSFCPYPLKDDKESVLHIDEIKKIIDQINPNDPNFKYVTFSQFNEPLLDNRIFEIIEYAQSAGLKVYFVTNGLLLNKQKNIDELLRLKPELKISLQIIEKGKHVEGRGLNMDLIKYSKTIFDFCEKAQNHNFKISIDIGCNFNDNKFKFYLKKFLGLQSGDPSIINDKDNTMKVLTEFFNEISKINPGYIKAKDIKKIFPKGNEIKANSHVGDYNFQQGLKIAENIEVKIKPFFYGRRISDFHKVPSKTFLCKSEILGILSDGNIVPCCLAYDDKISLGNTKEVNLKNVLEDNEFLKNLRSYDGDKHEVCRKCFGEPTKRGTVIRTAINYIRRLNT